MNKPLILASTLIVCGSIAAIHQAMAYEAPNPRRSTCLSIIPGDVDLNWFVDGQDVDDFVRVLNYPDQASIYELWAADVNFDGGVDNTDTSKFVDILLGGKILGDVDLNGRINNRDIDDLVQALLDPGGLSEEALRNADMDQNDFVDAQDVAPFVTVLDRCQEILLGDVDLNGYVDGQDVDDFNAVLNDPASASCQAFTAADINMDDRVDEADASLLVDILLGNN